MTAIPIADFLTRFTAVPAAQAAQAPDGATGSAADPKASAAELAAAAQAQLEARWLSGVREGEARAAAALEQAVAAERAHAENVLEAERSRWAQTEGERLAGALHGALEALEARIAGQVGRILEEFLPVKVRAEVLGELRENVAILLRGEHARIVRVSGPADLLCAMREAIPARPGAIEFVEADVPEVSITAEDTTIRSQLRVWEERLGGVEP